MSRPLEPRIPPALEEALRRDPDPRDGFTILVLTATGGWPHMAMVSVGELVPLDDRRLALALWPSSSAARGLDAEGRATLSAVVEHVSYALRVQAVRAGDLETPLAGKLARFDLQVESATADEAPYAVIESGVRFTLKDPEPTLARWLEVREALSSQ